MEHGTEGGTITPACPRNRHPPGRFPASWASGRSRRFIGSNRKLLSNISCQEHDIQQYTPRTRPLAAVNRGLSEASVLALVGARQVGKTTLAVEVVSAWGGPSTVHDLEAMAARQVLAATPERPLGRSEGLVTIDEIQRSPHLFETLRPICDDHNRKSALLHLGSVWWDLVHGVSA